jgi:hypothetical protein
MTGCSTTTERFARHAGRLGQFYVGSGLELSTYGKGRDLAALGRFFHPTRRAYGRFFYWGDRGWRALPTGWTRYKQDQRRGYQLWDISSYSSGAD